VIPTDEALLVDERHRNQMSHAIAAHDAGRLTLGLR
jgi:hypothetical protein